MIFQNNLTMEEKLAILSDAAKYDAACTSSGVDKKNNGEGIGNSKSCGICHAFSSDGRCISLLKILYTNECIYNCKYCINRSSNDVVRATFTPDEVCQLTIEFYRRNYIEGLFLSSGIIHSPDETMDQLVETVMLLRTKYHFGGYVHLKGIPGASPDLIEMAGWYVDRMSVNLELPTSEGLHSLAPHKTRKNILTPIRQIQNGIYENKGQKHYSGARIPDFHEHNSSSGRILLPASANTNPTGVLKQSSNADTLRSSSNIDTLSNSSITDTLHHPTTVDTLSHSNNAGSSSLKLYPKGQKHFVPGGQSTQMIIGATPESDYQIVSVAEALYQNFDLKRVFYSAFINVNQDHSMPMQPDGKGVPLLREHRLYQADWLMRFYGFHSNELLSEKRPNFNVLLDPKCDWAIGHLEHFPVEINKADYYTLLRVPGIGVKSAKRIMSARRFAVLDFSDLKKMGVVLKRALYFITCKGRMMYATKLDENYITNCLIGDDQRKIFEIEHHNSYQQLSLFDDYNLA